jgi:hypothetical protein
MTACGYARERLDTCGRLATMDRIDASLEYGIGSHLLNEHEIEECWSAACGFDAELPATWLLMARVAEAALLCAGHYADSCEFAAAGDFLVNPREILVHQAKGGRAVIKNRHEKISDQFGLGGPEWVISRARHSGGLGLEITKPPLLPLMTRTFGASGRIAPAYIRRLEKGQRRVADTLTFLAAWQISDSVDLLERLRTASARDRAFAEANLCRFDTRVFHRIGADLRQSLSEPDAPSSFLIPIPGCESAPDPPLSAAWTARTSPRPATLSVK